MLLTSHPGFGHFNPLARFGNFLLKRGHDVAFATAKSFEPHIQRNQFTAFPAGIDWAESHIAETFPEFRNLAPEDWTVWIADLLWNISPKAKVPDLIKIIETWKPDIIIHSGYEWAGALAAEIKNLPHAAVSIAARIPANIAHMVYARNYRDVRRHFKLPPDEERRELIRWLELSFMPPGWAIPGYETHPAEHFIYPAIYGPPDNDPPPSWLDELPSQPIIYATLGTVFNEYPNIFEAMIQAFYQMDLNLILALGPGHDPAHYGKQPPNIRIESFVHQSSVLQKATACINHGGVSTLFDAILKGVPQLLLPLGADQAVNTMICRMLGLAHLLPPELMRKDATHMNVVNPQALTRDHIICAVKELLGSQQRYRTALEKFHRKLSALPDIAQAIDLVERLAVEKKPITVKG